MGRYTGAVCRLCRREKAKLYLKGSRCFGAKCPVEGNFFVPGMHGPKKRPKEKMSDYALHLREKQKVRRMYGLLERQFKNYFFEAKKQREIPTGDKLMELVERRLDNVIFRASLAPSRTSARQIVTHAHIKVNGRRLDVPSYIVKPGDVIEVKQKSRNHNLINEAVKSPVTPPSWMSMDQKNYKIEILRAPSTADIDTPVNIQLVVEYYSR
ncbi:MAG TPA: 30S ribosomal protein S4 [Caldisericia bacterium]|nr:30S ribosomal protein S4 [Caldisericia bacterium]HPF49306.1 30S ribosomal protein S4 [Caldisericia bacterium]HPI84014.1 30S ribosomal protein S4 [Caldisericia bacterium]HPQ93272.1 30S ribosomal protein S4 [Caldisericia bacterium]HRV75346.1 30S ribosomal protein S4 [Caldisericia bacterium]